MMVIELPVMQFGLIWRDFKNFKITSMISDKKSSRPEVQLPLYYIHFEIAQFNSLNTRTTRFWSVPLYIESVAELPKSETRNEFAFHFENMSTTCQRDVIASCDWLFWSTVLFSLAEKKM